ncbi:hypothetical protein [Ammoniphilus sp. CFH 90114]|nr:hypothetical protein [Ammoniphilus sp. CFH 90114]
MAKEKLIMHRVRSSLREDSVNGRDPIDQKQKKRVHERGSLLLFVQYVRL